MHNLGQTSGLALLLDMGRGMGRHSGFRHISELVAVCIVHAFHLSLEEDQAVYSPCPLVFCEGKACDRLGVYGKLYVTGSTWNGLRSTAEIKHIIELRKGNQKGFP